MGRLLCIGAITAVFVAAAAIAITMTVARTGHDSGRMSGEPRSESLRLQVDERISPSAIEPGGRFRYGFRVTNTGDFVLRNVAVRSEKVVDERPAGELRLLSVSDRMCAVDGQVNCLFPELPPGGSRTVQVEALAVRPRGPGDRVVLHTFVGCFVPDPAGGVDFSVLGDALETTGRFVTTVVRHPGRAGGRLDDRPGGRSDDRSHGRPGGRSHDRSGGRREPRRADRPRVRTSRERPHAQAGAPARPHPPAQPRLHGRRASVA